MTLEIKEKFVNRDKGYVFSESDWHALDTQDKGQLYRSLRDEYGRCISKVYVDQLQVNGQMAAIPIGWVFVKRIQYEDCDETYLREVWVTVRETEHDE